MSWTNLICRVFALQLPLKIKACAQYAAPLKEKHIPVFAIAAYDSCSARKVRKPIVASRPPRKPCKL